MSNSQFRSRWASAALSLGVVVVGLFWRSKYASLPAPVAKYGGDVLWALLVFLLVVLLRPRWPTHWVLGASSAICVAVEFSQLYHAPWIDQLRDVRVVALAIGSTFNWPDLPAYAFGIALGWMLDWLRARSTVAL